MLILIAVLLALVPAIAILYPFVRRPHTAYMLDDGSLPQTELARRWEEALAGLRNAELELALGNLAEDDYRSLKEAYMTDAAIVMKAMDLEAQEESELDPMLPPSVGEVEIRAGEPLIFEATVEVRPEVEIDDLEDFNLPEGESEPSDEEIAEALGRLQEQVADWNMK